MTGFAAAKGSFSTTMDRDRQSIDGLGFRPLAVVAWWARQSSAGTKWGNRGGIGFWTGTETLSVAWDSADGETSTRTAQHADDAALLGLDAEKLGVTMRADVEFNEDGITLRYATRPSRPWMVHFLALGGSAVQSSRVGWISSQSEAPPARPKLSDSGLVLFASAPADSSIVERDLAIGFGAEGMRGRAAAGYRCPNGSRPGNVLGAQRCDTALLDWPGAAESNRFAYLQVEGVHARVGTDVSPAGVGSRYTRVGVRPEALLLFSWGLSPSPRIKSIGRLCIGGEAGDRSGCISWDDRNTKLRETATHVRSSTDHSLVVTDTRTGGIHALAKLTSIDDRGFTLDWINDGRVREFAYVALSGRDPRGRAAHTLERVLRLAGKGLRR